MKKRLFNIVVAFCISFIIMGALSLFSMERLNTYIAYSDLMDHSGFVLDKIFNIEKGLRDIDRSERGYMITNDTMYLRFLHNSIDSIKSSSTKLKILTADNDTFQANIETLDSLLGNRIKAVDANIAYVDTCRSSALSIFYYQSREQMLECSRLLKRMHDAESDLKAERYRTELMYADLTTKTIKWLLFVFCCITLFLFVLLTKELRGRMRYQDELQAKVIDLKRSHNELQEIAYVASHDLQEPLRKIQVFSDMLIYLNSDLKTVSHKETLQRINSSAGRLQSLITDLTSLTSLTKIDEAKKEVDVTRMLHFIISELDDRIKAQGAIIQVKNIPKIICYENQLRILFNALLDNALKFVQDNVPPVVTISSTVTDNTDLLALNPNLKNKKFITILVEDNGIGFDQEFSTKMFQIFQRLHQKDSGYEGKGIGLAICQRVMANHEGYILASTSENGGSVFKLFFPKA